MESIETMAARAEPFDHMTVLTDIFGGKPIIRDMRIAGDRVLAMLSAEETRKKPY